ncbi:endonuclease/exonuclease/phosphatase family protein [Aegicerativicinus sediminis]|uniref:endonuclease/exonuclease/phosphatase family protein n=1 Tax=Aegicerativicinus sediminis TaxID=2893202 RepID=UPI001E4B5673|nr:endonuclease/exonuclease/phosphatase family protein [Aegicerativicinus sediminis]
MKFGHYLILIVLFCNYSVWSQTTVDGSKMVRVLSFNILHGATTKGDFNLDVIAKIITDANPDFVAMQEVDFKTNRAKKYDLVTELGWRTKMAPIFGRAMPYDGGEYGEGILSKYSFLQSRNIALPHYPGNEPRAALEITTVLSSGDTIAFIGTHLDHLTDDKDRIIQATKINEVFSLNKYPTILAGDLNDVPGSSPINILEQLWTSSYNKNDPRLTYPSDKPSIKIDYVMFYPKHRWKILETEVICDTIASDHCAYLVILELLEE